MFFFFLSYFWQIQERDVWPVFYTNSVGINDEFGGVYTSDNPRAVAAKEKSTMDRRLETSKPLKREVTGEEVFALYDQVLAATG